MAAFNTPAADRAATTVSRRLHACLYSCSANASD